MEFNRLSHAEIDQLSDEEKLEYLESLDEHLSPTPRVDDTHSEEEEEPEQTILRDSQSKKRMLLRLAKNTATAVGSIPDLPGALVNIPISVASSLSGHEIPTVPQFGFGEKLGKLVQDSTDLNLNPQTLGEERSDAVQQAIAHLLSGAGVAKGVLAATKAGVKYGPKMQKFLKSQSSISVPEVGGAAASGLAAHEMSRHTDSPLAVLAAGIGGGLAGGYSTQKISSALKALKHGGLRASTVDLLGGKPDISALLQAERSELPTTLGSTGVSPTLQMTAQRYAPDIEEATRSNALKKIHELLKAPTHENMTKSSVLGDILEKGADKKYKYVKGKIDPWIKKLENSITKNPEGNLIDVSDIFNKFSDDVKLQKIDLDLPDKTKKLIEGLKNSGVSQKEINKYIKKNFGLESTSGIKTKDLAAMRNNPVGKYLLELDTLVSETPAAQAAYLKNKGIEDLSGLSSGALDNKLTLENFRKFQQRVGSDKDVANKAIGDAASGKKKTLYGEIKKSMITHLENLEDKQLVKAGTKKSWDKWHETYSEFAKKDKSKLNKIRTMVDGQLESLVDYALKGDESKSYGLLDMLAPHVTSNQKEVLLGAVMNKLGRVGETGGSNYINPATWMRNYRALRADSKEILHKYGGKNFNADLDDLQKFITRNSALLAKDNHSGTAASTSILQVPQKIASNLVKGKPVKAVSEAAGSVFTALSSRKFTKFAHSPETIGQLQKLVKKAFNIETKQQANAFINRIKDLDITDMNKLKQAHAQIKLEMLRTPDRKEFSNKFGNALRSMLFAEKSKNKDKNDYSVWDDIEIPVLKD